MINKENILVFNYDETLSEKIDLQNKLISKELFKLLLKNYKTRIIFKNNLLWIKNNGIDPLVLLLNRRKFDNNELNKIIKNLVIYTGGGNEKFFVRKRNRFNLSLEEDLKYRRLLEIEDIFLIQEIVKNHLSKKKSIKYYLKQHLSSDLKEIIRFRLKFENIKSLKEDTISKIKNELQENSKLKFVKILLYKDNNFLDFSFKDESSSLKDILSNNSKEIYYFSRKDISIDQLNKKRINHIPIENLQHMLSLLKSFNFNCDQKKNALKVLSKRNLKENIIFRLEDYWKSVDLPHQWIKGIINILSKYYYNEELAIKNVRKKYPEICNSKSIKYSKKLLKFRKMKVKNLAKRLRIYLTGTTIADIGGRADDLMEEVLKINQNIKNAYVTDIGSFSERSKNPKINFVVQPNLTRTTFIKDSINSILLSMVLHHLERSDQNTLINHLSQVLKRGGKIIVIEDTFPEKRINENMNTYIKEYLNFNEKEKKDILFFYDWFGNRLMRNRDNIALTQNYQTIEEWKKIFKRYGLKEVHAEFIKENRKKPDLFPPKGLFVYEKK